MCDCVYKIIYYYYYYYTIPYSHKRYREKCSYLNMSIYISRIPCIAYGSILPKKMSSHLQNSDNPPSSDTPQTLTSPGYMRCMRHHQRRSSSPYSRGLGSPHVWQQLMSPRQIFLLGNTTSHFHRSPPGTSEDRSQRWRFMFVSKTPERRTAFPHCNIQPVKLLSTSELPHSGVQHLLPPPPAGSRNPLRIYIVEMNPIRKSSRIEVP